MKTFTFLLTVVTLGVMQIAYAAASVDPKKSEMHKVTLAASTGGTYTISPQVPADGNVAAGTELTIKAKPSSGYALDAIFSTYKGGMWGTTSDESFGPEMKIKVDKDMTVGAIFVKSDLVDNINVIQNVVYAQPGKKALKYDVYAPKGAKNLPCVIIIHGGGWSSNNEDIMRGLARELTKGNQYVVFSIDYRWVKKLDGDTSPNDMHNLIEDVFGAIAHIQEHAAKYGGDPTRLALTGDSAGGHLSEAGAVLAPYIGDAGFGKKPGIYQFMPSYLPAGRTVEQVKNQIANGVKAVAPSYGPSDAATFKMFITQTDQPYYDAVSPIKHVPQAKTRLLPHFIVRGSEDRVVPDEAVQPYVNVLKAAGQPVTYLTVAGAQHAFFDWKPDPTTIATFEKYGVPYAEKMKAFFNGVFYK